jgi:threonine dehydrogenase-like Zn-dependent dehydrogenase
MLAVRLQEFGQVAVCDVPKPDVQSSTEVIVKVTFAAICGSDLSVYRCRTDRKPGQLLGHEFVGRVVEAGSDVELREGDLVASPFSWSDGTCPSCQAGWQSSCRSAGFWGRTPGSGGAQASYVRVPHADQTLIRLPADTAGDLLPALLTAGDVMATGQHGAVLAGVSAGSRVAVIGDGPVGLCTALAARRLGAGDIAVLGHHAERAALAGKFGASTWQPSPDHAAGAQNGFDCVIECVGMADTIALAVGLSRDGGSAAFVGVPHGVRTAPIAEMFRRNVTLRGGIAPARRYMPGLIGDILAGSLDPSPVFDLELPLAAAAEGYAALHARTAVKVLLRC